MWDEMSPILEQQTWLKLCTNVHASCCHACRLGFLFGPTVFEMVVPFPLECVYSFTVKTTPPCALLSSHFPGIRTNPTFLEIVFKGVFVSESWSSYRSLPILQLAKEKCFRYPMAFHSCKVTSPTELCLYGSIIWLSTLVVSHWCSISRLSTLYCHLILYTDCRQCCWNCLRSLTCRR